MLGSLMRLIPSSLPSPVWWNWSKIRKFVWSRWEIRHALLHISLRIHLRSLNLSSELQLLETEIGNGDNDADKKKQLAKHASKVASLVVYQHNQSPMYVYAELGLRFSEGFDWSSYRFQNWHQHQASSHWSLRSLRHRRIARPIEYFRSRLESRLHSQSLGCHA